jgi:phosphatidylglycerophosphate synthase
MRDDHGVAVPPTGCRTSTLVVVASGALLLLVGAALGRVLLPLGPAFLFKSVAIYGIGSGLIVIFALRHLGARRFGRANAATLSRFMLTALLVGLLGEQSSDALLWAAVSLAVGALVLDGVDGWLARKYGEASAFGARFDMETDAALILVLASLALAYGRAGSWVLLAGLMRYLFVAAGLAWVRLRGPLPSSRRRQTVCVLQAAMLVACLAPVVPPALATRVAALGVVLLSVSFAIDVYWLLRNTPSLRHGLAA